ncbi:glutathione S-transferase [Marinobacter xestospongiae]|uniref:Glutathione S-transferase family protein n=1 Tax=Marinobacter xestospongiae TaxID=994319 RepID=A0ABU3W3K1_9GAMM|nr:glutathione S-transferase family protein [Marinobacter xestospongiae]MDV2081118.1 glutathione S-transferase family protein [Marinobacter xestospongiae]
MPSPSAIPRFQLFYWPIAFRGCFVSYLFAYRNIPLQEETSPDVIARLKSLPPGEQDIPFVGPPVLKDRKTGHTLSQMPAIVQYAAQELGLTPQDPYTAALSLKVLMDCNDLLMELCRYNGSSMWTHEEWREFRTRRLPQWLRLFEEALIRGHFGNEQVTFADIGVYALFGNMIRCLPELEPDLHTHAPGIHALCQRIGAQPSLAAYVAEQEQRFGKLYCGGQIEASIRAMLEC